MLREIKLNTSPRLQATITFVVSLVVQFIVRDTVTDSSVSFFSGMEAAGDTSKVNLSFRGKNNLATYAWELLLATLNSCFSASRTGA